MSENEISKKLEGFVNLGHLHADAKGKIDTPSENGERYFVTIVDEYYR